MFGKECVARLTATTPWNVVGIDRAQCDITDAAGVDAVIHAHQPRAVINAAGRIELGWCEEHPDEATAVNVAGVKNIAAAVAARPTPTHLFHMSTCYVFGDEKDLYTEDDEPHPMQVYGKTKLDGERAMIKMLQHTPHPYFIFRTSWLYAATKTCWIDEAVQRATRGESYALIADQYNTVTRCRDLTDMVVDFILHAPLGGSGVYHTAAHAAEKVSKFDIGKFCLRTLGLAESFVQPMASAQLIVPRPRAAHLASVRATILPDCFTSLTTYLHEQYGAKKL